MTLPYGRFARRGVRMGAQDQSVRAAGQVFIRPLQMGIGGRN